MRAARSRAWQGLISASSYGRLTFPESRGRVMTVRMGKAAPAAGVGCPAAAEAGHADAIVKAMGVELSGFAHREYFVPLAFGAPA
eukprot:4800633-Pleurochrysis_carterae.AAC.1